MRPWESGSPPQIAGTDSHGRMDQPKRSSPQEVNARLTSRDRVGGLPTTDHPEAKALPTPAVELEPQPAMPQPAMPEPSLRGCSSLGCPINFSATIGP
jgi:hypothetical protein